MQSRHHTSRRVFYNGHDRKMHVFPFKITAVFPTAWINDSLYNPKHTPKGLIDEPRSLRTCNKAMQVKPNVFKNRSIQPPTAKYWQNIGEFLLTLPLVGL
jgi:hypothetical protein